MVSCSLGEGDPLRGLQVQSKLVTLSPRTVRTLPHRKTPVGVAQNAVCRAVVGTGLRLEVGEHVRDERRLIPACARG